MIGLDRGGGGHLEQHGGVHHGGAGTSAAAGGPSTFDIHMPPEQLDEAWNEHVEQLRHQGEICQGLVASRSSISYSHTQP